MKTFLLNTDPRLSDFEEEELKDANLAFNAYIEDLERHVNRIKTTPLLEQMLGDKVLEYETRIENLRIWQVQVINAALRKHQENLAKQN